MVDSTHGTNEDGVHLLTLAVALPTGNFLWAAFILLGADDEALACSEHINTVTRIRLTPRCFGRALSSEACGNFERWFLVGCLGLSW